MPREDFRQLEYVKWQEARMGTLHWRVFYTSPVDHLSFALSLHPPRLGGPTSKEARGYTSCSLSMYRGRSASRSDRPISEIILKP